MKKIMFNDKYGLTEAVLQGHKTMTRRIATYEDIKYPNIGWALEGKDKGKRVICKGVQIAAMSYYAKGEVVAIAQSYKDVLEQMIDAKGGYGEEENAFFERYKKTPGWNNKMFVKAALMPHRIRITDLKIERLQDVRDEDVYKEGFKCVSVNNGWGNYAHHWEAMLVYYDKLCRSKTIQSRDPREAFSYLIDKVSGRGTWDSNPWVFVYSFELVK